MKLQLTRRGYEEYLAKIQEKEEELKEVGIYKGKVAVEQGNVWHDNHDFEQAEIKERMLIKTISDMRERLKEVEIIEEVESSNDIVSVGKKVDIRLFFSEDDYDDMTIIISGNYKTDGDSYVSVNTPLAKTILNQKEGFCGEYEVQEAVGQRVKHKVQILKIY